MAGATYAQPQAAATPRFVRVRDAWRLLTRDKFAFSGVIIYVFFFLVAVFAPLLAPFNPKATLADAQGNWLANQPPGVCVTLRLPACDAANPLARVLG